MSRWKPMGLILARRARKRTRRRLWGNRGGACAALACRASGSQRAIPRECAGGNTSAQAQPQAEPANDGGRAAGAQAEEVTTAHVIARLATSPGGLSVLVFVRRDRPVGSTATSGRGACQPARCRRRRLSIALAGFAHVWAIETHSARTCSSITAFATMRQCRACPRHSFPLAVIRGSIRWSWQTGRARQARPFGMHLLAPRRGIRKTLSTAPFENPANTRAGYL
jgi:hypothetical protein